MKLIMYFSMANSLPNDMLHLTIGLVSGSLALEVHFAKSSTGRSIAFSFVCGFAVYRSQFLLDRLQIFTG